MIVDSDDGMMNNDGMMVIGYRHQILLVHYMTHAYDSRA